MCGSDLGCTKHLEDGLDVDARREKASLSERCPVAGVAYDADIQLDQVALSCDESIAEVADHKFTCCPQAGLIGLGELPEARLSGDLRRARGQFAGLCPFVAGCAGRFGDRRF